MSRDGRTGDTVRLLVPSGSPRPYSPRDDNRGLIVNHPWRKLSKHIALLTFPTGLSHNGVLRSQIIC
ncbi:MAG: hypothetical protein P8P49_01550 [Opitutales bacterium]|nr:hypothetical protein [Opitutales bacterium]